MQFTRNKWFECFWECDDFLPFSNTYWYRVNTLLLIFRWVNESSWVHNMHSPEHCLFSFRCLSLLIQRNLRTIYPYKRLIRLSVSKCVQFSRKQMIKNVHLISIPRHKVNRVIKLAFVVKKQKLKNQMLK